MHLAQLEKDAKAIFVCKGYDTAHHILLTVCVQSVSLLAFPWRASYCDVEDLERLSISDGEKCKLSDVCRWINRGV